MCIIEQKTYKYPDREEIVETTRLCFRAVGDRPCQLLERKDTGAIQVVETRPSTREHNFSRGLIVTEGFNGRQRVYRDLSTRSSNSSSFRYSGTMSERSLQMSPVSQPSSTSSPACVELKPKAPTPPDAGGSLPVLPERIRSPYQYRLSQDVPSLQPQSPLSPPDPRRMVTPEGTAIYDRPPSLDLPRELLNERHNQSKPARKTSVSSMNAEVDDADEASLPKARRKPNITIDTKLKPSTSSSSTSRNGRESDYRRDSKRPERQRERDDRLQRAEQERHRQQEDERQVRLERERLAESKRRRTASEQLPEESSRERHRREAAEALEGQKDDIIQQNIDADLEQMARERAAAASRRRDSELSQRYADDHLRQDPAARSSYYEGRRSPTIFRTRRIARDSLEYPSSPARSSSHPVTIHQELPSSRRNSSIRERGDVVIAREQARDASRRLETAVEDRPRDDQRDVDEYERGDGYYVGEGQDRRRRRRHGRRERPPQQFYK